MPPPMSGETMREAVARAFLLARGYPPETIDKDFPAIVKRYQEMCADWPDYYNAFSLITDAFRDADISIRTVLERLREPSDALLRVGVLEIDAVSDDPDGYPPTREQMRAGWQAMLDAAAREALPESADSGRG